LDLLQLHHMVRDQFHNEHMAEPLKKRPSGLSRAEQSAFRAWYRQTGRRTGLIASSSGLLLIWMVIATRPSSD
jgi:hypothetical protein